MIKQTQTGKFTDPSGRGFICTSITCTTPHVARDC